MPCEKCNDLRTLVRELGRALDEAVRVFEILPNRPVIGSEAEALIFAQMWNQVKQALLLIPEELREERKPNV